MSPNTEHFGESLYRQLHHDIKRICEQVVEVAFDPSKAHNKDYVRVNVKFDVPKPLRGSKVVNLGSGESVTILYDYERLQKRCYTCQRLIHEQ